MASAIFDLPPTPTSFTFVRPEGPYPDGDSSVHTHHETVEPIQKLAEPALEECDRFHKLQLHASGGQGEVYIARDEQLRREVAVKELKVRHANRPLSRARFLREAEIAGGLEHPGVVPVYALGKHLDGRPFYAMRLIQGRTMHQVIREFHRPEIPWSTAERNIRFRQILQRFISVCQTIAYAHSRGIVHRDIKPSNVLIGSFGEAVVVDWGLARHYHEETGCSMDADDPGFSGSQSESVADSTQMGSALGTPAFMSPEQAAGKWDEVGPVSDVYSLGATLYVLLSGHLPLKNLAWTEMSRRICAGEIQSAKQVNALVPRGLDAICRKAMAVHPARRYQSASELSEDIEHWLADEPVAAEPEPISERVRRWIRRHRMFVSISSVGLIILTGALAVGLVAVDKERGRTEVARLQARGALDSLFSGAIDQWLSEQHVLRPEHRKFLESALEDQIKFANETPSDPAGYLSVARSFRRVGEINIKLGRIKKEAVEALNQADNRLRQVALPEDNVELLQERAKLESVQGGLNWKNRKFDEAEKHYANARRIWEGLDARFPSDPEVSKNLPESLANHAVVLADLKQYGQATESHRKVLALRQRKVDDQPSSPTAKRDLLRSHYALGNCLLQQKLLSDAEQAFRNAIAIGEKLNADGLMDSEGLEQWAAAEAALGRLLMMSKKSSEAKRHFQLAANNLMKVVEWQPSKTQYAMDLVATECNLGNLAFCESDWASADEHFAQAVAVAKRTRGHSDISPRMLSISIEAHRGRANALAKLGRHLEAAEEWAAIMKLDPKNFQLWNSMRAKQLFRAGHKDLALHEVQRIIDDPQSPMEAFYNCAVVLMESGDSPRALSLLQKAATGGYFNDQRIISFLDSDAAFDKLRDDPSFKAFRATLGNSPK